MPDNYVPVKYDSLSRQYFSSCPSQYSGRPEEQKIVEYIRELEHHARKCLYFNGFSIARQIHDRESPAIVRCCCSYEITIDGYIWSASHHFRYLDLEDVIANMNCYCNKSTLEERVQKIVSRELSRIRFHEEIWALNTDKERKSKGIPPTYRLEV